MLLARNRSQPKPTPAIVVTAMVPPIAPATAAPLSDRVDAGELAAER